MSESCMIEVYENECFNRSRGWVPHPDTPYVMKANFAPCKPLDEISVPSHEWQWSTNWKITKMPGVTDKEGWEYASRFARFNSKNRTPQTEQVWSRARRRLWTRVMRREAVVKNVDIPKITHKVQTGLTSIHQARLKIEEIMKQMPEAADTDQMRTLVTSVNRNIVDILSVIDNAEKQCQTNLEQIQNDEKNRINSMAASSTPNKGSNKGNNNENTNTNLIANTPGVLKKLRNDVLKEQAAIERALDPSIAAQNDQIMNRNMRNPSNPVPMKRPVMDPRNASFSATNNNMMSSSVSSSMSNSFQPPTPLSQRPSFNHRSSFNRSGKSDSISGGSDRRAINGDNSDPIEFGSSSKKKVEVKSGSIGAFNPSLLVNHSQNDQIKLNDNDEVEDGVFVDRSTQDMIIAQKLIPIDEGTVMQEIIDERSTEIEKIHKGLVEINDLFNDLSKIVKEQEVEINTIYGNIDESHQKTKEAFNHIVEANRLHQTGSCIIS